MIEEETFFEADDDTGIVGTHADAKWNALPMPVRSLIGRGISHIIMRDIHLQDSSKLRRLPDVFQNFFTPLISPTPIRTRLTNGVMIWYDYMEEYTMGNITDALHYMGFTEEIEEVFGEHAPQFFTRIGDEEGPMVATWSNFTDSTRNGIKNI